MDFENKISLGKGIYTFPDISQILRIPNYKVNRWINHFWDGNLGKYFNEKYSWNVDFTKAVSFHTMVELYSFYQLSMAGVHSKRILEAHKVLSEQFTTPFPFANSEILDSIATDGRSVFFDYGDERIYSLDVSKQFKLNFIRIFFKKLDFDDELLASRLWPIGKDKSIVCDPTRKFGLPIINNKNIYPETIASMHKAGDSVEFLAEIYQLTKAQIHHAIEFCNKAA